MPLILAIEPDRRQAARISSLARERLNVELLVMDSVEHALEALSKRIPDLILMPQLLSPKDEAALNERLRQLDAAGSKVQTLMIPVLASTGRRASRKDGLFNRLRGIKDEPATEGGCDPAVFAAQIAEYLEKAADEHAAQAAIAEDDRAYGLSKPKPPVVDAPAPGDVVVAEPVQTPVVSLGSGPVVGPSLGSGVLYEFEFQQSAEQAAQTVVPEYVVPECVVQEYVVPEYVAAEHVAPERVAPPSQVNLDEADVLATLSSEADEPPGSPEPVAVLRQDWRLPSVPNDVARPEPVVEELTAVATASAFDEFVVFEELGVVDSPALAFGEFATELEPAGDEPIDLQAFGGEIDLQAFAEELEASATAETTSVFDAFEILDEPEIPIPVDFQVHDRVEGKRRPALVAVRELDDETDPDPDASDFDAHCDLWMPLPVAAQWRWPIIEGPAVKAIFTHSFDAPPDPDVEFAPPSEDRGSGKKRKGSKPYQDEWGFFDPVQCGFAALLAKLDEVTDK